MKPDEKMTPEDVEHELSQALSAARADKVRAHIAALEAERDEALEEIDRWKEECGLVGSEGDPARVTPAHLAADLQKRDREADALRERVTELEGTLATEQAECTRQRDGWARAESTLSAMRQCAADADALERAYQSVEDGRHDSGLRNVARYILGEDAGAENPDATSEADTPLPEGQRLAEPTTAEAFATVRSGLEIGSAGAANAYGAAFRALSLLERRMGAMARAGKMFLDAGPGLSHEWLAAKEAMQEALTDAPPVFTREEVEDACAPYFGDGPTAEVLERLCGLRR